MMKTGAQLKAGRGTMHSRSRYVWLAVAVAYLINASGTLAGPTNAKEEVPAKEKLYGKLTTSVSAMLRWKCVARRTFFMFNLNESHKSWRHCATRGTEFHAFA